MIPLKSVLCQSFLSTGSYKLYFEWESRLVRGLDGIYISSYEENGVQK